MNNNVIHCIIKYKFNLLLLPRYSKVMSGSRTRLKVHNKQKILIDHRLIEPSMQTFLYFSH